LRFFVIKNLSFLYILQISNYLFSFLLTPFLARVLGVEGFGNYSYCLAANAYLWMLVDWGFVVGGVQEVALHRESHEKLTSVFWKIIVARTELCATGLLLLCAFTMAADAHFRWIVFASGLLTLVGAMLCCDWFVQGMERMGLYATISIASRLFCTLPTFLFVRAPEDVWIAAGLHGAQGLFTGLSGFVTVLFFYRFRMHLPALRDAGRTIVSNFSYFLSRTSGLLYVGLPPLVLGIFSSTAQVGLYSGPDKIARICVTLIGPISAIVAPRVFSSMSQSPRAAAMLSGRYVLIQLAITAPIALGLFCFAPRIIHIVLSDRYGDAGNILRVLSFLPILLGLSSALNVQFLAPLGRRRELAVMTVGTSAVYLVVITLLSAWFGALGASFALLASELILIGVALTTLLRHEKQFMRDAMLGIRTLSPRHIFRFKMR
jgi:O-antigen/teichoic acid export membrane protein